MAEDPRALPMAAALAPRGSWMRARADETLRGVVARDGLDVPRGGGMDVLPSDVILQGHTSEVYSAAFDPSGETVVTASRDKTARLWDARTGECRGVVALGFAPSDVRFGMGTEAAITFSGRNAAESRCALVVRCEVPADWSVFEGPLSVVSRASCGAGMLRCDLRKPNGSIVE